MMTWVTKTLRKVATGILLWGCICSLSTSAQEAVESVFLPAPRAMRQHLARAQEAVSQERYGDAVAELGAVLTTPQTNLEAHRAGEPQDFFIASSNATGTRSSLKTEAHRLLGSLPPRGRALYELQYGAEARSLLERAVRAGDFQQLNDVTRRYFHTKAGYDATMLLGRLNLDQGRPLAATLCFQRVLQAPESGRFEPDLSILLAGCYLRAGQPERATQTLANLRQRFPQATVRIGPDQPRDLPRPGDEVAWLTQHFNPRRLELQAGETQWVMYRGNASRNARSVGGVPLRQARWQAPTPTDPLDEKLVNDLKAGFVSEGRHLVPSLHPLAVDDVVLMRTPERLLALDFESGKRIWEYPWWDLSYQRVPAIGRAGMRSVELSNRRDQLMQRLWYDAPYGQVSSDGESVFLIDDLRYAMPSRVEWIPGPRGGRQRNPNMPLSHNQLVSLDLSRQGALRWMVGGETGLDEPKLVGAFFLGPPLPLFGQLYVLAELRGEIRLVVLDAKTGRQEWSQQLAHVDSFTIAEDLRRRMIGASPSFADGILICPTSASAVVAVDISTRSLLWGNQYGPSANDPRRHNPMRSYSARASIPETRWLDATATVVDGAVILTPPASNRLYCLDLVTGERKWGPLVREGHLAHTLFIACVHQGRVVLVGQHHVTALGLDDGQSAWKQAIEFDHDELEVPSGRGFLSGKFYYLPTTASRLLKIDVEQGKVVETTATEQVLGNLICFRDHVIAQGVDCVSAFYQVEPLRERVAARLETSADDVWALARQGELRVNDADLAGALDSLRKAHRIAADDPEVRSLLVTTYLSALRDDFETYQALAGEMETLIEQPARRIEYLRHMGGGLQDDGQLPEALATYLALIDLIDQESEQSGLLMETPVALDTHWSARIDLWVGAQLARLYLNGDETLRRAVDIAAEQRLEAALQGSSQRLANFVQFFRFHALAEPASLQWARQLVNRDELLAAEITLGGLQKSADPTIAASAIALLGDVYQKAGQYELAAGCYQRLRDRWPEVSCSNGQTGREIWDQVSPDAMIQQGLATLAEWPWGEVESEESADGLPRASQRRVYPVPVQTHSGPTSRVDQVAYDTGASSVIIRDATGRVIARNRLAGGLSFYSHQEGVTQAATLGNSLFLMLADQIALIDTLRVARDEEESVVWRDSLTQTVPDISPPAAQSLPRDIHNPLIPTALVDHYLADQSGRPLGQIGPVTCHGICYQKARTLLCVDPMTNNVNWSRRDFDQGVQIFGDEQYVFVREGNSTRVHMLDAVDGRSLGYRPIPTGAGPWTIHGRFMLCWEKAGERGTRLFLYNVAEATLMWSQEFARGSRGCLVGDRFVAILDREGGFVVRSLEDDRIVVDQQLEAEPKLGRIVALLDDDRLILLTSSDSSARGTMNGGVPVIPITGRMYAFSRETGEPLWQVPAFLDDYGFPMDQPAASPVLWFFRQYAAKDRQLTPVSTIRASVACVDRRSGRLLLEAKDLQSQANFHETLADRDQQLVRLVIPGYTFRITFTDKPTPPSPTAQTGSSASAIQPDPSRLGRIVNSLLEGDANEQPFDPSPEAQPVEKPN
jgi:outer membrane protein assembly factor BamB